MQYINRIHVRCGNFKRHHNAKYVAPRQQFIVRSSANTAKLPARTLSGEDMVAMIARSGHYGFQQLFSVKRCTN